MIWYKVEDKHGIENMVIIEAEFENLVKIEIARLRTPKEMEIALDNDVSASLNIIFDDEKGYLSILFDRRARTYCRKLIAKMGLTITSTNLDYRNIDSKFVDVSKFIESLGGKEK